MKIILLRHGKRDGDNLTEKGKIETKQLCEQLKAYDIKHVFVSPMNRCQQTADIACQVLGIKGYEIKQGLAERWQLGHKPQNSDEQAWWDNYLNYDFISNIGESCREYADRNVEVFKEAEKYNNGDVLIVAHSATSYVLTHYMCNNLKGTLSWMKLGYANHIVFEFDKTFTMLD